MSKRLALPVEPVIATIDVLDAYGRGVTRVDGRPVHIPEALPTERIAFRYVRRYRKSDLGQLLRVLEPHPHRVPAGCFSFSVCGGCRSQHVAPYAQLDTAQTRLLSLLNEQRVEVGILEPPICGPLWGYRRRARLAVRHVPKKGGVLVGFREKANNYVADMRVCQVLEPQIGGRIGRLRNVLSELETASAIPQIEVAAGDDRVRLVIRHLSPLSHSDLVSLRTFQEDTDLLIALQPAGLNSVIDIDGGEVEPLTYRLPDFGVKLAFLPTDFIQINRLINCKLVSAACELLALSVGDKVLDLFCGLGNFTLPMARAGCQVLGLDNDDGLLARARQNARENGIENVSFQSNDLHATDVLRLNGDIPNKVILDPPRSGANAAITALMALASRPSRLVYVSCGPESFARDAALLTRGGYVLNTARVVDMFPHTGHFETLACFELR